MAEYRVLKPFTYLRGDGAVVRQTKTGVVIELDDKCAEQGGAAVEAVNKQTSTPEPVLVQPAPAEEIETKPKRRSHRHSGASEPEQSGSEEGASPVAEADGQ